MPLTDAGPDDRAARAVVAAFDFDGTILAGDSLVPFLVRAFGRARVAATFAALPLTGLGWCVGRVPIDAFKRRVLRRLVAGVPADRLRTLGTAHARALVPRLRPAALERLAWHRAQGHSVVLVSSTLDLYLDDVGASLGVDAVLCSRLRIRVDADGIERCDGALDGPDCTGDEKLRRLIEHVGPRSTFELHAYGDSDGDAALLAAADHAHFRPFR